MLRALRKHRELNEGPNAAREASLRSDFRPALRLIEGAAAEGRYPTNRVIALISLCRGARDEVVATVLARLALDEERPRIVRKVAMVGLEGSPFDVSRQALRELGESNDKEFRWLAAEALKSF